MVFYRKSIKITLSFEKTLKKIEKYENFDIAPLDIDILKVADKMETELEMHDRLIIATSLYFNATLITKDQSIRDAGICSTIW